MSTIEKAMEKRRSRMEEPAGPGGDSLAPAERSTAGTEGRVAPVQEQPRGGRRSRYQALDPARMQTHGLLLPDGSRGRVAEEFRLIKRPLLNNIYGHPAAAVRRGNLLMVTSALPREGKTFCAINLALSITQEVERTVLLVDADVARPSVLEYTGVDSETGLLDVLVDPTLDLSDVIVRTDIPNLSVLPAGNNHSQSTELLASRRMAELTEELAERYSDRVVVFDSPPLLATTEASVLAQHMGQIVVVVEAGRTPESSLTSALEQLESCDVVLTLLNKTNSVIGAGGDYGYYGSYR